MGAAEHRIQLTGAHRHRQLIQTLRNNEEYFVGNRRLSRAGTVGHFMAEGRLLGTVNDSALPRRSFPTRYNCSPFRAIMTCSSSTGIGASIELVKAEKRKRSVSNRQKAAPGSTPRQRGG